MISIILLLSLLTIFALLLIISRNQYTHWNQYNIPSLKAKIPYGNLESVVKNENSFGTAIYNLYKNSKDQVLGIYLFFRPALLVRDPVLIKNVLTSNFDHFHDRGVYNDPKNDPMSSNIFAMEGAEWKNLRSCLTPAFTSGKLKGMFETISNIGQHLVDSLKVYAEENAVIELRDFSTRYVADSLASIAFGQEGISTIDNPKHEFRMKAIQLNSDKGLVSIIRGSSAFVCPSLLKILRIKGLPEYMRSFCLDMVTKTINHRETNNIVRKDLMQYLIQLRNGNNVGQDDWNINTSAKNTKSLSYEQVAANVFLFYIAGNDSSSSTIAYTLYELTQNKELLDRVRQDIQDTLQQHDGNITYDSIKDMQFLDCCVKETLRKHPALPILNRECTKDYKVPGMDFVIKKGTSIIISLLGVSRDEKYFPGPEKYDPDRFSPERKADLYEDMFMPFGAGPRNCIAFRMGILIVKVALVKLLTTFDFEPVSIGELEYDYGTVTLLPKEGQCVARISSLISS